MAGIYIHIPFCKSKCIYCGFYSKPLSLFSSPDSTSPLVKLTDAIKNEIEQRKDFFKGNDSCGKDQIINTLYFGGGTPSLLSINELRTIQESLYKNFHISPDAEFTIEVNPDDITPLYAKGLREIGVNRISMGVQSFTDEHLKWMRRRHSASQSVDAFNILREAGFLNISIDLIFGFSSLSMELLDRNLEELKNLRPEHVSTYQLSVDAGSVLEKLSQSDKTFLLADEDCAAQYTLIQRQLEEFGYHQYEVSNFARDGFFSRHNSAYWDRTPYLGLGPGAHSFSGTYREWNDEDIEKYCALGKSDNSLTREVLTPKDIFTETLMLGLRLCSGVSVAKLHCCAGDAEIDWKIFEHSMLKQIKAGNIVKYGNEDIHIKIPQNKLFVSDSIILSLLP